MPDLLADALAREKADLDAARKLPLWGEAVQFMRDYIPPSDKGRIRAAIAHDGIRTWITPYHFHWGMAVRNALRAKGFGEREFMIDNLDNIYVPLIEEAVAE